MKDSKYIIEYIKTLCRKLQANSNYLPDKVDLMYQQAKELVSAINDLKEKIE